jgi:protein TonB
MTGASLIEARWWGSTSASVAAHTLLFALMMLIATRVSNISDPPRALNSPFVFVPDAGAGGGGGGGGDTRVRRPRPAVINRAPVTSMPTPSETIQPSAQVPVPAITATAVETLPGAPATIDASVSTAPGKGDGPGGGGGRGAGSGSGNGSGLGDGLLAGFGGDVYLPGNGISDPVLVREVKPNYTADALRAKLQGTVEMEAVVLANGTIDPRSIRILRSLDPTFGLDREAVEAVKRWRFSPALRKGQPVAVLVTLELAFTLR